MSPRLSSVLIVALCTTALVSLNACDKSGVSAAPSDEADQLDHLTTKLLAELALGDRDAARALCNSTLASDLGEADVAVLARTLAWLGPVEELELESEEPVTGGARRRYQAQFGRGRVGLVVTVVGDRFEGFELDEAQWARLVDGALEAAAGTMSVAAFGYLDSKGQPTEGPTDPSWIRYELTLDGLEAQLREHHVVIAKTVVDAKGDEVYRQPEDDDIRFPQGETGSTGGRVTGTVAVPGPGSYVIEFEIRDLIGTQELSHRVSFVIE